MSDKIAPKMLFVPKTKKCLNWINKWATKLGRQGSKRSVMEQAINYAIDQGFEPKAETRARRVG